MEGIATESEKAELENLIGDDEHRRLVYRACMEDALRSESEVDAAFHRHWERMHEKGYVDKIPPVIRRQMTVRMMARMAAAALVIFCLGWLLWLTVYRDGMKEITTEYGQRKRVELPDGSVVWLNGGSKLMYGAAFNVEDRKVKFHGEGYFEIEKDHTRPFVIDAGDATVKVLGTIFNLRAYKEEERVETSLIEGQVELTVTSSANAPILLTSGKKLSVFKNEGNLPELPDKLEEFALENRDVAILTEVRTADGETEVNDVLWKENKLVFDGDNLDLIASKLQKWYGVEVSVADTALRKLKFSGIFEDMSLDAVLQTLTRTGTLQYRISDDTVLFLPNESN